MKRTICLIVMLLFCFSSYCQINKTSVTSTGDNKQTVTLSIDAVRALNDKLIERNYLLEENAIQDSIITNQTELIKEYKSVTQDLQDRLEASNKLTENLRKQYNKQRTKTIIASTAAGAAATGFLISILFSTLK